MKQEQFLQVLDGDEALSRFLQALEPLPDLGAEVVALADALGRVLAEDVRSPVDVPGFDRSNMDGFAVRAEDTFGASELLPRRLGLAAGVVTMGRLPESRLEPGEAMPIPTGGALPRGADAVVMVEHTSLDEGGGWVEVRRAVVPGQALSYAGSDIASGETVLRTGDLLTSRETGVLAAIGQAEVAVRRRPRVAIISTGDEIIAPGQPLAPGQIYDSNAVTIADAVRECGGLPEHLGIVADDEEALAEVLQRALGDCHVVLLSGGTSKGPGDLNVRVLRRLLGPPGVVVHGVALKPGKPLCLAVSGRVAVAVLPGFPTSAIFTFHGFIAPYLRRLTGRPAEVDQIELTARLPIRLTSDSGRTEHNLVRLVDDDEGQLLAYPIGKGSGSVTSWCQADGYFVIPKQVELVEPGTEVTVRPMAGTRPRRVDLVVIGSHCVGLDILLGQLRQRGFSSKLVVVGSEGGLRAAARGACDVAGIHLLDPGSGEYNRPFVSPPLLLIEGYRRMQGVLFRRGDSRFEGRDPAAAVRAAASLPPAEICMINRNRGSGTRVLYDQLLGDLKPPGHSIEATSHHAVAAAVEQGRADFGIAIDVVAADRGLGFLELTEEHFDFAVPASRRHRPAVQAFIEVLRDEHTRELLRRRGLRA